MKFEYNWNKWYFIVIFPSKAAVSEQDYKLDGKQKGRRKIFLREIFDNTIDAIATNIYVTTSY